MLLGIAAAGIDAPWRDPATRAALVVGGLWLDALKMTVIPLIVALLITGIVGSAEAARAGGLATRSILWFVVVLTGSAIFGGVMMPALLTLFPLPDEAAEALRVGLASVDAGATAASVPTAADFLRSIIPPNVIAAAAEDKILPLVVFTAMFAFAMTRIDAPKRQALAGFFEAITATMLVMIGWVLWIAPVGVLGAGLRGRRRRGRRGTGRDRPLCRDDLAARAARHLSLLMALRSASGGCRWATFARAMVAPQAVAISTQSSLASLPAMLTAAKEMGVRDTSADVTLPLAVALFRATGPAMNFGVAFYVAHWFGIEPSPIQMAVGDRAGVGDELQRGQPAGADQLRHLDRADRAGAGRADRAAGLLIAVETIPDIFRTLGNVTMDVAVTAAVACGTGRGAERSPSAWRFPAPGPSKAGRPAAPRRRRAARSSGPRGCGRSR